jgi:cysteine desulfurase family protein (TIGR01976 family)
MTTTDTDPAALLLSVDEIRSRFPALERVEAGHPVGYFDGPGGTQVPRSVVEAMVDYLYHHNANTHWNYPSSAETDAALAAARLALADFLGATSEEVVFGANMTTLVLHVSRAMGAGLAEGDEIVVTDLDHQANVAPWHRLARERGLRVRIVPMLPGGTLDWEAFEELVGLRTRVVAIGAASNAIGTVNDVTRAVELARSVGALSFVDAVHHAPHFLPDVAQLDCDLFACSAYKFHGPHVGVLYGKRELLEGLDVARLPPASNEAPERIETGTLNHEGIVGAAAAVDFFASLLAPGAGLHEAPRRERLRAAFRGLHARGERLFERLWDGLAAIDGVQAYGPPPGEPRTATIGFTLAGHPAGEVCERLAREAGVFLSDGDFYATTVIESLGLRPHGLVRAGCVCTTTEEEIDRLVAGVARIAGG